MIPTIPPESPFLQDLTRCDYFETSAKIDKADICKVVGDTSIQSINRATVAEYKATLKKLPPNKNKTKKYRGKTIAELVDMPIKKTLSVARVNKNLQRAGALFDHAINHGIIEGPNPATKMQLPKDKWDIRVLPTAA